MTHQRLVHLTGAGNFRDLGGYKTANHQQVAWGKIYRADSLSELTDDDLAELGRRHVTVDCDLRSSFEQGAMPDQRTAEMKVIDCHVYPEGDDDDRQSEVPGRILRTGFLESIYQRAILNVHSQQAFAKVMNELVALPDDQALVFHCSAGKDRTGMMAGIILKVLGMPDKTIIQDYLLTNQLYDFSRSFEVPTDNDLSQMVAKMNTTQGDGLVMKGLLDTIQAGWGTIDTFVTQQLGISTQDIQILRQKYLE